MKTKLGVSVGLLGAAIYFGYLFSGYTVLILIAGYVLLKEENAWLKKSAVKAVALAVCFSLAHCIVGLIPDGIGVLSNLTNLIGKPFGISIINKLVTLLNSIISILKTIIFLLLGLQALSQKDFPVSFIDKTVEKNMQ